MSRAPFYCNCVGWPPDQLDVLLWLQDHADEIDLGRLREEVDEDDLARIERGLGYGRHLQLADDYHVTYYREPSTGICFIKHSAIEWVFATTSEIEDLQQRIMEEEDECENHSDAGCHGGAELEYA